MSEFKPGQRDAIHQPVIYLTAHRLLTPGRPVGVHSDGLTTCAGEVGIVDPFADDVVRCGDVCAVYLPPGSVSNVRHEWTHPEINKIVVFDFDEIGSDGGDCAATMAAFGLLQRQLYPIDPPDNWGEYVTAVACHLECSTHNLLNAADHIYKNGNEIGGAQCSFNSEAAKTIDWSEFWRRYNEQHQTNVDWDDDPFCCDH